MKRVSGSALKTYIGEGSISVNSLSGSTIDGIIAPTSGSGLYLNIARQDEDNLFTTHDYLLSGSDWSAGDNIRIKAPQIDGSGKIRLFAISSSNGTGGGYNHVIDGIESNESGSHMGQLGTQGESEPAVVIESPFGAFTLILGEIVTDGSGAGEVKQYHWSIL